MASASGVVGMQKCWGDPRHWFAPTTPAARVVDAHRTRGLDFYGQILLWPPKCAQEWPVQPARLGCRNFGGTPGVGLHAPHPAVASWTQTVRVVWTSIAIYCYGQPSTRTNGQCKQCGWYAEMLGGPPASVSTHQIRWSCRGRKPYAWFGIIWPDTSMATQVRARMASESGAVGMQKCSGDPRRRFAPTTPGGRVVDAQRTCGLDLYFQILLRPTWYAHEWPVQAAGLGCRNVGGTLGASCDRLTRWWRHGRTPYAWFGFVCLHTSMATQVRARMATASGVVWMQKCWRDPPRRFPPTAPGERAADARTFRCVDFYGHIPLWPPKYAPDWPVPAA